MTTTTNYNMWINQLISLTVKGKGLPPGLFAWYMRDFTYPHTHLLACCIDWFVKNYRLVHYYDVNQFLMQRLLCLPFPYVEDGAKKGMKTNGVQWGVSQEGWRMTAVAEEATETLTQITGVVKKTLFLLPCLSLTSMFSQWATSLNFASNTITKVSMAAKMNPMDFWSGNLTLHGLWPEVNPVYI